MPPIRFIISLLFVSTLFACSKRADHKAEIATLDSLASAIEALRPKYEQLDLSFAKALVDSVETDIKFIQDNYQGKMDRTLALLLVRYRDIKKNIPDMGRKQSWANEELDKTIVQLHELKQALISGASKDAVGNNITEEYITQKFREETNVAETLLKEMDRMIRGSVHIVERYDSLAPLVQPYLDSLKTKMNP